MKYKLLLLIVIAALVSGWFLTREAKPVEPTQNGETPIVVETPSTEECFVGGCSGQICSDEPGGISTCEFRAEYACYRTAQCERQTTGKCSWTETPELKMCLANPPALQ